MNHPALVWIQIPAENIERAAKFYTDVFGYKFFFETLNNIPHAVFEQDAKGQRPVNGALVEVKNKPADSQGCVLFFQATGRFELIMENIESSGGKILVKKTLITKKIDATSGMIPDTYIDGKPGYFVHFLDSEGNKMGLYGSN